MKATLLCLTDLQHLYLYKHFGMEHLKFKHCFRKDKGMIEVTGRRRRRKQLLDDRTATRRYLKLKEEALDRNVWRIRFGRGYGPVVRQTAE